MNLRESTHKQEVDENYKLVVEDIFGYLTFENRQKWMSLAEACKKTLCYLWVEGRVKDYKKHRRITKNIKNIRVVIGLPAEVNTANWMNSRVHFVYHNGGLAQNDASFFHTSENYHPPSAA